MRNTKLLLSVAAASVLALNGCIDISRNDTLNVNYGGIDNGTGGGDTIVTCTADNTVYAGTPITTNVTWNTDTCIDGKIVVESGASITASDITVVAVAGTQAWIEVLPGGKINATNVLFTSEEEASGGVGKAGQWGGVTLIGSANKYADNITLNDQLKGYEVDGTLPGDGDISDSSGKFINCTLNNTGIAVVQGKEINGLSLVAVGNGTIISGLTVNRAGDDAVEIWGGHVNLTNVTIVGAGDDGFDNDDGWAGEVDGLSVSGVTNSGLELSGTTHATYKNVTIDTTGQVALDDKGGAIYLKGSGIGGFFDTVTIKDNSDTGYGAIVIGEVDGGNLTGTGISISGTNTVQHITTTSDYQGTLTLQEVADLLGITL